MPNVVEIRINESCGSVTAPIAHAATEEAQESIVPRLATGKQMYERLVRSGPPFDITLRDDPRKQQPCLSTESDLAARPQVVEK